MSVERAPARRDLAQSANSRSNAPAPRDRLRKAGASAQGCVGTTGLSPMAVGIAGPGCLPAQTGGVPLHSADKRSPNWPTAGSLRRMCRFYRARREDRIGARSKRAGVFAAPGHEASRPVPQIPAVALSRSCRSLADGAPRLEACGGSCRARGPPSAWSAIALSSHSSSVTPARLAACSAKRRAVGLTLARPHAVLLLMPSTDAGVFDVAAPRHAASAAIILSSR